MTVGRVSVQDYGKLIQLPVQKKLLSLLQGHHGGTGAGASHEFLDMAEYRPGDAIADIDWKSTARFRTPIVKRFEQTAVLNVVLAVDTGSGMGALAAGGAASDEYKEDVSAEVVLALAWLTAQRGDHLGLVAGNKESMTTLPARSGFSHAQTLERLATSGSPSGPPGDFTAVLRRLNATRRGKALVVAITDETQADAIEPGVLKQVATKHELLVVLVKDANPADLQGRAMEDVAAGPLPYFAGAEKVSEEWQLSRETRSRRVAAKLKKLGVKSVRIGSRAEVPRGLVELFGGPHAPAS